MTFPTLYKRTSTGAIQIWEIIVKDDTYYTRSGQINGAITESKPTLCEAKNVGRANATTGVEQAIVEAQAKYDKQLKSKYKTDIASVDIADFISPTLASPLKDRKKPVIYPAFIQVKYNGVCCLSDKEFGCRSRKGEIFYNIKHIKEELDRFFEANPDVVFHGELFNNDLREDLNQLIELVAVTRKEKDLNDLLIAQSEKIVRYYIYDGYIKGKEADPYKDRIVELRRRMTAFGFKYLIPAPTFIVKNEEETIKFFEEQVADKQEGAILRMVAMPYVHKRTKDILKYKVSESAEFLCTGFLEGTGNWAGCAKKAIMVLPNGKTFNCNMKGSQEFLKEVWENQEKFSNKYYICDFQNWSEYGVPQIGYTGLVERNYE